MSSTFHPGDFVDDGAITRIENIWEEAEQIWRVGGRIKIFLDMLFLKYQCNKLRFFAQELIEYLSVYDY